MPIFKLTEMDKLYDPNMIIEEFSDYESKGNFKFHSIIILFHCHIMFLAYFVIILLEMLMCYWIKGTSSNADLWSQHHHKLLRYYWINRPLMINNIHQFVINLVWTGAAFKVAGNIYNSKSKLYLLTKTA